MLSTLPRRPFILLGGRLALRSEQALRWISTSSPGAAYEPASFIVVATLALEALGAGVLALRFSQHGMPLLDAIWHGVFHAVGAFCHAGFSLWPDSLISQQEGTWWCSARSWRWWWSAASALGAGGAAGCARGVYRRFSLRTRGGAVDDAGADRARDAAVRAARVGRDAGGDVDVRQVDERGVSVDHAALRAGFNTVDFTSVEQATIAVMMVWIFIGAAPGGTGGGIKVTTLAVLAAAFPALLYNQAARAVLVRRAIPNEIVHRAATIVTVAGSSPRSRW